MKRRIFLMEVEIYDGSDTVPVYDYIDTILNWYETNSYDELHVEISHVEHAVFRVEYDSEIEEDEDPFVLVEQAMIADPDDDGNYPVDINGRDFLVAGKVLS